MNRLWVVGLVAVLAACASPVDATGAPVLDGTRWTVTHLGSRPTLAGRPPTMAFAGSRASGTTGCNGYGTSFTQDGQRLRFGEETAMSAMLCDEPDVMAQEEAVARALGTVALLRSAGDGLELLDAGRQVVLVLARVRDAPLEATTWQLSGLVEDGAVTSTVADSIVTMTISGGRLAGRACNTFRGPVSARDGSFAAGPLVSTRVACASAEESVQEAVVLETLEAATSYTIEAGTLTLSTGAGSGLVFTAA